MPERRSYGLHVIKASSRHFPTPIRVERSGNRVRDLLNHRDGPPFLSIMFLFFLLTKHPQTWSPNSWEEHGRYPGSWVQYLPVRIIRQNQKQEQELRNNMDSQSHCSLGRKDKVQCLSMHTATSNGPWLLETVQIYKIWPHPSWKCSTLVMSCVVLKTHFSELRAPVHVCDMFCPRPAGFKLSIVLWTVVLKGGGTSFLEVYWARIIVYVLFRCSEFRTMNLPRWLNCHIWLRLSPSKFYLYRFVVACL